MISLLQQIYTLLQQIMVMFLLMLIGFTLYRKQILDEHTTKQLSKLLAQLTTPAVIIASFQRTFDPVLAKTLFIMLLCAFISFALSILLAQGLYGAAKYDNFGSRRMCAVFSNDGFMALPLLQALFGSEGIFLGSAHIVANTIMVWTYGVWQLTHDRKQTNLRTVLLNPGTLSLIGGLLLFVSPIKLPSILYSVFESVGSLNTPIAMLILGSYVAKAELTKALRSLDTWKISLVRLLIVPVCSLIPLLFIPISMTASTILLIGIAAPVAVTVATFAQIFESDYLYSTRAIALSTLLSAITLPILVASFQILKKILLF